MSRVGNKPVALPVGVGVAVKDGIVSVKGAKGELVRRLPSGVSLDLVERELFVRREDDSAPNRAKHGLVRALLSNMVVGVSAGFEKKLEIQGIGYKAEVKGSVLNLNLGYSHPVEFPFPNGVSVKVDGGTKLTVLGIDREAVGQAAAEIRAFRSPDSYKGKGVRYVGERVRLKAGKSQ
jgi:large subunit ribosomal protein L6